MMTKPLIPFGWMPGHWGLRGSTREVARAEYELEGADLELRLAEIRLDPREFAKEKLRILHRHGRITAEELETQLNELAEFEDPKKKALAKLDLDLKYQRISQEKYDRAKADLMGEPWVSMPRIHWNPAGKARAYFEVDYNEHFLRELREHGYQGADEDVVNQWLNDTCAHILMELNDPAFISDSRPGAPNPQDE